MIVAPPEMHAALAERRETTWDYLKVAPGHSVLDGTFTAATLRFIARLMDRLEAQQQKRINASVRASACPEGRRIVSHHVDVPVLPQEVPALS